MSDERTLPPHNHPTGILDARPCSTECSRHHAFDDGDRADLRVTTWLRSFTSPTYHEIADAIDKGAHHDV